jgi:hypothetical protein
MKRMPSWARLAATLFALYWLQGAAAQVSPEVERGRAIYMEGRYAGQPVRASRPDMGPLPAHAVACVTCHRRSGLGGIEGSVPVPAIATQVLMAPGQPPSRDMRVPMQWLRHQARSAYTEPLLVRLLQEGIDPDGHHVAAVMPRYELTAQAQRDLLAYLAARPLRPTLGITAATLHLATVVTEQAPAGRQRAVRVAMQAWSRTMGLGGRRVQWQEWPLVGEPATWAAQLRAHWQAQPVYALVSGAGGKEWAPVEAFCESQQLPCLFPSIDRIPVRDDRYWSVYLSGGIDAEAHMLAQHLSQSTGAAKAQRVVPVARTEGGHAAAQRLRQLLQTEGGVPVVPTLGPQDDWPQQSGDLVVLWLDPQEVGQWLRRHSHLTSKVDEIESVAGRPGVLHSVLLSAQLAPAQRTPIEAAWRPLVRWISQQADPVKQAAAGAMSLRPWMRQLGLPDDLDALALSDAHAATYFFSDALALTRGVLQQDFLLERLEQAIDRRPPGAHYFQLSLGPGQRVAAKGGFLLGFTPPLYVDLAPLPGHLRTHE